MIHKFMDITGINNDANLMTQLVMFLFYYMYVTDLKRAGVTDTQGFKLIRH